MPVHPQQREAFDRALKRTIIGPIELDQERVFETIQNALPWQTASAIDHWHRAIVVVAAEQGYRLGLAVAQGLIQAAEAGTNPAAATVVMLDLAASTEVLPTLELPASE